MKEDWTAEEKHRVEYANELFPVDLKEYGPGGRTDFLIRLSSLVETRIAYEAGWISQRMTWLIVSQSFLFAAFVQAFGGGMLTIPPPVVRAARYAIPIAALVQASMGYVSILSAKRVAREIAEFRGRVDDALRGATPGLSGWCTLGPERFRSIRGTYDRGGLATHWIPVTLIAVWSTLFVIHVVTQVRAGTF